MTIILKEYITNDVIYLKDYLSMPVDQKIDSLPEQYPNFYEDFLIEMDIDEEAPSDIDMEYGFIEELREDNPKLYRQYGQYLYDKIKSDTLPIPDNDYPAWAYFDDSPQVVKNQWLIHFTNDAFSIAKEGFTKGVGDMNRLHLTTSLGEFEKKYGGYNFAYLLSDFEKYGKVRYGGYKYGNEAVVFRASGLKVWHYGDEEQQVIFFGDTAKDIVPISEGDEGTWEIISKEGDRIFDNEELQKVAYWIANNFNQYRKKITFK